MGCAAAAVLIDEIVHNLVAELLLHVQDVVRDAEEAADGAGILHVIQCAATLVIVGQLGFVEAVQLHGDADYFPSGAMQQQGGDAGIDASAHGYNHPVLRQMLVHAATTFGFSLAYPRRGVQPNGARVHKLRQIKLFRASAVVTRSARERLARSAVLVAIQPVRVCFGTALRQKELKGLLVGVKITAVAIDKFILLGGGLL